MNLNVLNNCNHYSVEFATAHDGRDRTCAKGIDIREHVGGDDLGWLRRLPCVKSSFSKDVVPCALAEFPTAEERAANEKQLMADLATLDSGTCPDCGKVLVRQENTDVVLTTCPDGHVSMRGCKRIGASMGLEIE